MKRYAYLSSDTENDPTPSVVAAGRLLTAMTTPGTLYVLGAGASYGLVPTTAQRRRAVKASYASVGSFPVTRAERYDMYDRVIGQIAEVHADAGEDPYSHDNLAEAFLGNDSAARA